MVLITVCCIIVSYPVPTPASLSQSIVFDEDDLVVGYGIRDTELGAVVTSYEPHTPDDFIAALRESVTEIKNIVS